MTVLLLIFSFMSIKVCFIYLGTYVGSKKFYKSYIFLLDYFLYHYVVFFFVSYYNLCFKVSLVRYEYCYTSFLFISICMKYFHLFTFSVHICFISKLISCKQYRYGSCVLMYSATLCVFIGAFKPFTFKVSIDRYIFIVILFFLLYSTVPPPPPPSPCSSSYRRPFNISYNTGVVVTNSFSLYLS